MNSYAPHINQDREYRLSRKYIFLLVLFWVINTVLMFLVYHSI